MESFYSELMAECEKKANQMVALENESTVMRENIAKCILSLACVISPEIPEQMRNVNKAENQSQLKSLTASVSLGAMLKVDSKDSDENSKNSSGHPDIMLPDQGATSEEGQNMETLG